MKRPLRPSTQDWVSEDFRRDPYPLYVRLRYCEEPFFLPHRKETSSGGVWLFSRYQDAQQIFAGSGAMTTEISSIRSAGVGTALDKFMLHRDGDDHLRLRKLVAGYFSARAIDGLRPQIASVAQNLVAPLLDKPEFDFVRDFAEPLPLTVIAALVGVPDEDMPRVRQWSLALGDSFDSLQSQPEVLNQQKQAVAQFLAYIESRVEASREKPDSSLLSFLVSACGQSLDHEELAAMLALLLFAGNETTISLLGNMLWSLLSHPRQWALVRKHHELVPGAVEEALRYESPQQRTSFRIATAPLEIGNHTLQPGQQFGAILGSANRDESVFERADEFDITRSPNRHLAFGTGVHNCLGKALARLEAQVALHVLLESMPDLEARESCAQWRRNSFFRGLENLWLTRTGHPVRAT